jgi:hypothetical protein
MNSGKRMDDALLFGSIKGIIPLERMVEEDKEETHLLREMANSAEQYLTSFKWCKSIRESFFGDGIGGIIAVFLFRIDPAQPNVDDWLWVIVGDVPPAYLVTDFCKTPSEAIRGYIREMRMWVELARKGKSSVEIIPVNVPATPEWAENLNGRLNLVESIILPHFKLPRNPSSK